VTGAREEDLLSVLEKDTYGFWTDFARRPGGASGAEGGAIWFRSGIPLIIYNGFAGEVADVEAVIERVRAWGVPARWTVSSTTTPAAFETRLADQGLTKQDEWAGMVARIDELPGLDTGGATMEVVRGPAQSEEWVDVLCDAFALETDTAALVHDMHAWPYMHDAGLTYVLVRVEGKAVATGLLRSASGVAGVYGIGVRRDFQRKGLGALATLLTVREGARTGARVAILQATAEGLPLYQKLGFQTITWFRSWRIA
jgi:GNAT superfamily N-acetyltransferase